MMRLANRLRNDGISEGVDKCLCRTPARAVTHD